MQAQEFSVQRDDVESNLCGRRDDLTVIRGDPPQRRAFSRVHRLQRRTELPGVTALYFDDHERRSVETNGIDFPSGNSYVASQDAITASGKKVARPVLPLSPFCAVILQSNLGPARAARHEPAPSLHDGECWGRALSRPPGDAASSTLYGTHIRSGRPLCRARPSKHRDAPWR